ncbi:MAG: hypothetical protein R6V49_00410 [Bacteroidales bacterium]
MAVSSGQTNLPDSTPPLVYTFPLLDTTVEFHWHQSNKASLMFLVIHDDENTSSEVGFAQMKRFDASLVEMKNDGKYLFNLISDSVSYLFNPNRIFCLNGIENTLLQYGPCADHVASGIHLFAQQVAGAFFLRPDFIVALHNNRNNGFSINSYLTDSLLISTVDSVFVNPEKDPDNFFYVNDPEHFTIIRRKGYNVVMQSEKPLYDDGSLSYWCHRMKIPYVNIEAEHGHHEEQICMLEDIYEIILLYINDLK